ncbi:MAG TPA: pyridoxamine 5'-phosphate oxidase family protein [Nakamurella sp.]|nr:pyridoxamine 5'-phosphate oxidase family protein [Nakamurella sp.]
MGKVYPGIDDALGAWLLRQPVFFVGTAPLSGDGSINVSPKGMAGTFAVLGPQRVAYLDYTGSGTETIAHVQENGRIVIMFCNFDGPPKIVRLHGKGRAVLPDAAEFGSLRTAFAKGRILGQRSIVVVELTRVSDSCGHAVPLMDFRGDRDVLDRSQERRDPNYFSGYWRDRNAASVDGLPGVPAPSTEPG